MRYSVHPANKPRAFKRKKPTAEDHVDRMIDLAGRIADGKVTPARIRRLSGDDALIVLLSLRYSGELGRIDDLTWDEITGRISLKTDKN